MPFALEAFLSCGSVVFIAPLSCLLTEVSQATVMPMRSLRS
jgi:hypothetical protein